MVFVTAEIGINHNGDLKIAKQLIDLAKKCDCDAVKFQKRTIDKVYSKEVLDSPRESPWGKTTRDQKNGLEFTEDEYDQIDSYCKEKKIDWYASAWDIDSQLFLRKYNLKYNKISSALLTHSELLKTVAEEKKYCFISTGMSTMEEISRAVDIFRKYDCPFELMHTTSTYPMALEEANLKCIQTLKERYNCKVGYSGHENSLISISMIAVAFGATSVERHVTVDRTMYGSDQAASIEAKNIQNLSEVLNKVSLILGDGQKKITEEEEKIRNKLRIDKN